MFRRRIRKNYFKWFLTGIGAILFIDALSISDKKTTNKDEKFKEL